MVIIICKSYWQEYYYKTALIKKKKNITKLE